MPDSLTPAERSLRARIAANVKWSQYDPIEATASARAVSPGADAYWEKQVDPDGELPEAERLRRAQCLKRAHFQRMALASARARSKGAA